MFFASVIAISVVISQVPPASSNVDSDTTRSPADMVITDQQTLDARAALDAMALSLRTVQSGTCRMQCRLLRTPNANGEGTSDDAELSLFIAFDKKQDFYRYDRLRPNHSGRPEQMTMTPHTTLVAPGDWKIANPPGRSHSTRTVIRETTSDRSFMKSGHYDPLMSALSDCLCNDLLYVNQSGSLDRFLNERLPQSNVYLFDNTEPNRVIIGIREKDAKHTVLMETVLTLDTSKQYVPIRVISRHDNGTGSKQWTDSDVSETDWTSMNGVFVPQRTVCTGSNYWNSNFTFTREWEHVNESLDSKIFSEEAFDLHEGDIIAFKSQGEIVIEKIVGLEPPKMPHADPELPKRKSRLPILLLINVVLIGAVLLYLRWKKGSSPVK